MRAIAVDDEKLGLGRIVRLLKGSEYFSCVKGYTKPEEAIKYFEEDNADIAFLDIEMPEMNGLQLSETLMERNPRLEVVFVTAYDKYALQAFEINAIGYLLKPVELKKINDKIERILIRQKGVKIQEKLNVIYIQTFEHFLVSFDKSMKNTIKFRTEKAKELLGYLLSYQGKPVSKDKIIYTLWPDMEPERAAKNFHTTCYYIRKVFKNLGVNNLILRKQNGYSINEECIASDLSIFCNAMEQISKENPRIETIKTAFFEYNGAYLENEDYLWAVEKQSYYEDCYESMGIFLEEYYKSTKQTDKAENVLRHLLSVNPLSEKACVKLIELYMKKGDKLKAKKVYKTLQKNFDDEVGKEILNYLDKLIMKK